MKLSNKVYTVQKSIGFLMWDSICSYSVLNEATKEQKRLTENNPKNTYRVISTDLK